MKAVKTLALGAVGIVGLVGAAAPASAQYVPGYGYGQYGYPTDVIGQVLQSILTPYGQFGYQRGVNPQFAVNQCTATVQQRLYRYGTGYGGYGGYGQPSGGYSPYGYTQPYSQARILGITRVEQRSATTMRVRGVATSGMMYGGYGGYPYGGGYGPGGYGGYSYGQAQSPDLSFRCDVDHRGYIRNIRIDRLR
jgi:hypothetical protein